ncbi:unnamed protein product [Rotaria sp. Silwood1]|nr:unnamed protein product [Rotaria sp. Silwood1]
MTGRIKLPFKIGESKKNNEFEINETSKKEDFSLSEIVRYGFPYQPSALAYDSVQKLLAIGTKHGVIKIYGGAFVECSLSHPTEVEIVQLVFRINEGALISACRDNYIHLWSLRQKKPVIANSLRFVKEKISRCLLPLNFNSKWLFVGTCAGNVYVVNLDTFTLSSYKIMWNNAIGMGKSTHPGVVVDLCQNPDDPARLYIGFSTHLSSPNNVPMGHVVCWNLQQKTSENVYTLQQGLTSISWHYEGRQFMCSHCDGSLSFWNLRSIDKPVNINYPHLRISKDEAHQFGEISKVVWSYVKNSNDAYIIFSGGMPVQIDSQQIPSTNTTVNVPLYKPSSDFLTILRGQTINVLNMDSAIIDFHVITASPHITDAPDPSAIIVLLENNLVIVDLKSENYPIFESLHTLDLHEPPVTYCDYMTDPNTILYQNLLRLQTKQTPKRPYSQQENPVSGGKSGSTIFGYNELIITGHADGSIKFWDASGCNLSFLYKLCTNRLFIRTSLTNPSSSSSNKKDLNANIKFDTRLPRANNSIGDESIQQQINTIYLSDELNGYEYPFAIYSIKVCCDGKYLIAAALGGHVTLFKFTGSELDKADEGLGDLSWIEIPILHGNSSNDHNDSNTSGNLSSTTDLQSPLLKPNTEKKDFKSLLRAKMGSRRMAGYQPELVCLLSWLPSDKIPVLSDISINSKFGLLILGLENGLVVIDYLSKSILMNMATADLYGTMDPFQRTIMSPKRHGTSNDINNDEPMSSDHQRSLLSHPATAEPRLSKNPFIFSTTGPMSNKLRAKASIQTPIQDTPSENLPKSLVRSRSSESIHGDDKITGSHLTGGRTSVSGPHEEKPLSITTLSKTIHTLRKRLSRPAHHNKQETVTNRKSSYHNEKDNTVKGGGDDSGSSSAGEELSPSSFTDIPTPNPNVAPITPAPATALKVHRSYPLEKTSSIITPPPLTTIESHETDDDSKASKENTNLSKTWAPSTFTRAQLHGTCSLEYTEHMRDKSHKRKAHMIDLRKDDVYHHQQSTPITHSNKSTAIDLPRSASVSSLDKIILNESICAIQFSESFTYKNDFTLSPSVWLGTSTGCVLVINLNIIYEPRNISVVPSGSVFRLNGRLLHISFLDHKGVIIPPPSEKWDTKKIKTNRPTDSAQDLNASSILPTSNLMSSPVTSTPSNNNIQYAVFCSSKQARVVALPSQTCVSKQKIYDSHSASASNVFRATVVKIAGSSCLTCYLSGGRIHVYSLPSLRELFVTNLDIVTDSFRSLVATTCTFTDRGHAFFMCSPTEIQKLSIASDVKEQVNEMICELYDPSIAMPEAPKQNFFAKIFASNSFIDSEELFGEAAGTASFGIVKKEDVNANMNRMHGNVDSATSVVNETRTKLIERGQKLSEVEMASKQLSESAEEFATLSHKIMLKQKEKAEWWPFTSKKS